MIPLILNTATKTVSLTITPPQRREQNILIGRLSYGMCCGFRSAVALSLKNMEKKTSLVQKDLGSQVITRVDNLMQVGFTMPADYNHVNAIKASMLVLNEMRDRDGKTVFETCTPASIQTALFEMATKGLDVSKKQAYFIKRGTKLCLDDSYFGKVLQVKRVFPNFDPRPRVVYAGDEFAFTTDPQTGRRSLVKHEQKLDNIDGDFVGAYLYLPCVDGGQDLYIMTKKQILTAWSKSSSKEQTTHKLFTDKMVGKTIVNSACNMIINSTPSLSMAQSRDETPKTEDADAEEVSEAEYVGVDAAEAVPTEEASATQATATQAGENGADF